MSFSGATIFSAPPDEVTIPPGQIFSLLVLLAGGTLLILFQSEQASMSALVLLAVISTAGLEICKRVRRQLNDASLGLLGYFWVAKLGVTLILLYAGWVPQLDPATSPVWGYDPQRYFAYAQEIVDNDWAADTIGLNYLGIVYYYAAMLFVFGNDPVIPALINAFVTLLAACYLIVTAYEVNPRRKSPRHWTLCLVLLLPDMLWFDVMTSRESLSAALLLLALLTAGRYLGQTTRVSLIQFLAFSIVAIAAIGAVRTSLLLPVFLAVSVMVFLVQPKGQGHSIRSIIYAATTIILLPVALGLISVFDFDLDETVRNIILPSDNFALSEDAEWTSDSIGRMLIPNGALQAILFTPPRLLLYLLAPLPNLKVSLADMLGGSWEAWQYLCLLLTAIANVAMMPFALASLGASIRNRIENSAPLILHLSYWITLIALAGGNLVIHERYRVMTSMMLFAIAWLGYTGGNRRALFRASLLWYGLLGLAAALYLAVKWSGL